ncbi:unnamed protein product [Linum trigynum]|uniref:Uncharacterized protein n=1 Tax=Linum trigynum TaxID=586398 RepID=A0AAV2CUE4_9ROSI
MSTIVSVPNLLSPKARTVFLHASCRTLTSKVRCGSIEKKAGLWRLKSSSFAVWKVKRCRKVIDKLVNKREIKEERRCMCKLPPSLLSPNHVPSMISNI